MQRSSPKARRASVGATSSASSARGTPVSVLVRCRPAAEGTPVVRVAAEPAGHEKILLRLDPGDTAQEPSYAREKGRALEGRSFRCNGFCGECSSQEDVFVHARPVIDGVMEGYNGTIFCYGITGSGKSYTMSGLTPEQCDADGAQTAGGRAQGIVQRAASRIFEFIRDRSEQGEVFSVEASFLEIYSSDGISEMLVDLLADGRGPEAKLEMRQDPLNGQAFVCEGLRRVPISSPSELHGALEAGRRRCTFMETTRNCHSSRSHCLFLVTVECLPGGDGPGAPAVRRGKLVLVDLAGSESLKKVVAASEGDESLRRRQAIGINRVLSHLGLVVNNLNAGRQGGVGYRNSALTMMLRDCLGGAARALLVANMGPELEWCSETYMTLTFAQKMMQVRNTERQTIVEDKSHSTLLQMRQRHQDCIQRLKEGAAAEGESKNNEELQKIQSEVRELNSRLLTKSNVTETLARLQEEQRKKMDELRSEMSQTMTSQFATMQEQSLRDMADLRQVIETKTREGGEIVERHMKAASEAQLGSLQESLTAALERQRWAMSEAAKLRIQLEAAQQRVQMLQELQQDFAQARAAADQERQAVLRQAEEQRGRFLELESEANRFRVEAEVLRGQAEAQRAAFAGDAAAAAAERRERAAREAELRAAVHAARERLEAGRLQAREATQEAEASHCREVDGLRAQASRLESEAGLQGLRLEEVLRANALLQGAVSELQEIEEKLEQQLEEEGQVHQEELDVKYANIDDLTKMLDEIETSIMHATSGSAKK